MRLTRNIVTCFMPLVGLALLQGADAVRAADTPTRDEAVAALRKAVNFMHKEVAVGGGYVWRVSGDMKLREGEGNAGRTLLWVQPPGTPSVGEALLDAYLATGDAAILAAARDAAMALVRGQMHSGGWHYSIETDESARRKYAYRQGGATPNRSTPDKDDPQRIGGWDIWKRRALRNNLTVLDDDTTQAATRFLIRIDKALGFKDADIHDAALHALKSLLSAQYPIGAWSANYDRFPHQTPSDKHYPVIDASFPDDWPRQWPNDWTGCYVLNDNIQPDMVELLLLAHDVYKDEAYMAAVKRAGDFLIRAQLPQPQPAWAQQYDRHMHPVWSRKFEPPAVTGGESQNVMRALMQVYEATGDDRYLEPLPAAIAYLRKSEISGGRLARFYELKTNRPLYFKVTGKVYNLTYEDDDLPDHYGFQLGSNIDGIERQYEQTIARRGRPRSDNGNDKPRLSASLSRQAAQVIAAMDARGAWTEQGVMRDENGRKTQPKAGIVESRTFIKNVEVLCRFIRAAK